MAVFHLGPKAYSSWSLRPWLLAKELGYEFTEEVHPVSGAGSSSGPHPALGAVSPSGLVPCLALPNGDAVWDSLAICEYLSEAAGGGRGWPADPRARAFARCISAEMHSGFGAVRAEMPMNVKFALPAPAPLSAAATAQVARIVRLWADARREWGAPSGGGPYLFGAFCAADAMFAPVALRFRTYAVRVEDALARAYCEALLENAHVVAWCAAGRVEGGELLVERYDLACAELGGVRV
jgi:glutathione S-transferase